MKALEKLLAILMLLFAIGFNLWLYRLEPTATIDPNDNAFQYALIDRTNTVWDFSDKYCAEKFSSFFGHWDLRFVICQIGYLVDHWVPNWAEGYNLPYYYSHLPQVAIVGSYKLFAFISSLLAVLQGENLQNVNISLFSYYHWIIYILLSFFPLSVFLALRVIKLPLLAAGLGTLVSSQISTDGLHGLDPASYLWRGYGLTSQLFAQIWLPLAIAYAWRFLQGSTKSEIRNPKEIQNSDKLNSNHLKVNFWNLHVNSIFDIRYSDLFPAVFFLTLTTSGHLGVGIMAFLSIGIIGLTNIVKFLYLSLRGVPTFRRGDVAIPTGQIFEQLIKTLLLVLTPIFLLSYWIVPILLHGDYHNISFWDPVWKFNSLGAKEVMRLLFNGDIFDFGRFPTLTVLTLIGLFAPLKLSLRSASWRRSNLNHYGIAASSRRNVGTPRNDSDHEPITMNPDRIGAGYEPFSILFVFWLLMYFGRTTWGNILNLIPGMNEFHQHRFVVGVHLAGLFLIPIGANFIMNQLIFVINKLFKRINYEISKLFIGLLVYSFISLLIIPQTTAYSKFNDEIILRAKANHAKVKADEDLLFATLKTLPPGRVFAGRGGGWGKDFRIAETPWYMNLTTYGVPSVLWLPETWSPNSDIEQYFSEDQLKDYELFGMRYVVAPPKQNPQPFWKLIKETETWKLYEIFNPDTTNYELRTTNQFSYFTTGIRPAVISTTKTDYINLVRLWIQSDYPKQKLFPELRLTQDFVTTPLPHFRMLDEARYQTRDGKIYGLFGDKPTYQLYDKLTNSQIDDKQIAPNILINQSIETNVGDMIFGATVEVKDKCPECLVILKQSAHPNWKAYVDNKRVQTLIVFPFYSAVKLETPGTYKITFKYEPSGFKMVILILTTLVSISFFIINKIASSPPAGGSSQ